MQTSLKHPPYSIDTTPPWPALLLMGLQHLVKFGLLSILVVWIARTAQVSQAEMINFVSLSLIGAAISTLFMMLKRPIGGHCFIPAITSISYFACLLHVAQQGRLSQVLGAGIIIALTQMLCSFFFPFLKKLLTIELAGLGLFAMGVWAAVLGISEFFHPIGLGQIIIHGHVEYTQMEGPAALLGILTLIVMLLCFLNNKLRCISILLGILVGWIIGAYFHFVPDGNIALFKAAPWFAWPHFFHLISFDFSWKMVLIFIGVGVYTSLICFSLVTVIAHENAPPNSTSANETMRARQFCCGSSSHNHLPAWRQPAFTDPRFHWRHDHHTCLQSCNWLCFLSLVINPRISTKIRIVFSHHSGCRQWCRHYFNGCNDVHERHYVNEFTEYIAQ